MTVRVLITGITGQDGSCLTDILLKQKCQVHGVTRRSSTEPSNLWRIREHLNQIYLHGGDLTDPGSIDKIIRTVQPSIIFNMAAQSFVHTSFDQPKYTCDVDMYGFMYIMESLKKNDMTHVRVYQAGSSEQFGTTPPLQNEDSPMEPNSPYGIAKLAAHKFAKYYRNVGFWTTVGILFNHEEPGKRGQEFVTRKIAVWCAQARYALCHNTSVPKIRLGNMGAKRDWGRAYEYMEAAVRMMTELQEPVDLVIATGETHTVLEFFQEACKVAEIPESVAVASLEIDPMLVRQAEVPVLCGDASKAKRVLGWESKVKFPTLVQQMVEVEIENAKNQK